MILAVAATPMEMEPFSQALAEQPFTCLQLVSGVGPVETTLQLTRFLLASEAPVTCVLNFGIGGAYRLPADQAQPDILDICIATEEVMGDYGIAYDASYEQLPSALTGPIVFHGDLTLQHKAFDALAAAQVKAHRGVFVTVNGVSGSAHRGEMLRARWNGLCENMEGGAIARVCHEFKLPFLEMRCISNFVEDRNPANWRLAESCQRAGTYAARIIKELNV